MSWAWGHSSDSGRFRRVFSSRLTYNQVALEGISAGSTPEALLASHRAA